MNQQNKLAGRIDYGIVLSMMLLMIISLVSIYSAQLTNNQYDANFVVKQAMWFVVSTFAIIVVMQLDYDRLTKWVLLFLRTRSIFTRICIAFWERSKRSKELDCYSVLREHSAI